MQVLNELASVARRKMRMSWGDTHRFLSTLRELLTVHPITIEVHESGLALAERYNLSLYDAMIAASALHAGCDTLWSEDMQHGMTLEQALMQHERVRGAMTEAELRAVLDPTTYVGRAPEIVDGVLAQARKSGWMD